jgi:hypothetical protein
MRQLLFASLLLLSTSTFAMQWQCYSDADCDPGSLCVDHVCEYFAERAPQTPTRYDECMTEQDCPSGYACFDGICKESWPCWR